MTKKLQNLLHSLDYGLLIAFVIPLIGMLPTFGEGLANGADAPFHAHRIYALSELIQNGNFYPRWVTYFHMGYGYPVFNFYAPGATHIGAWFHLIGFDVVTAYNLTNALVWSISSVGMYLLARTFLPIRIALLACILWAYAPSRFYEFWWQGSIAQIVATSFIPFVFYGIIRTTRAPNIKNSLWIGIPFALIVLSHTPTTYITALFVAPFCMLAPLKYRLLHKILQRWLYIVVGLVISAGLSAIFLIPVFAEVGFVRIAGDLPDTISFLRQNFGTFAELFSIPQIIDSNDATLVMPRALGFIGGILSLVGVIALIIRRQFAIALLLVSGLGLAIFLALEPSLDLWLLIPGFRNLRFPERILRIGALFIALLGASSLLLIPKRWHTIGLMIVSGTVVWQALPIMHPRDDDKVWENLSALDEIQMEFEEHNWGTTAYDEYEPIWGEVTPLDMPEDVESYIDNPFQIRVLESDAIRESDNFAYQQIADNQIQVTLDKDLTMRFRQFYFPGWKLTLDSTPHPITPDERFGLIEAVLPEGQHTVQLDYVGTSIQHISTLVSLLTVLGCLIIIWRDKSVDTPPFAESQPINAQLAFIIVGMIILFAILNRTVLQDTLFRIQSPPDQPHYMQTSVNATFDGNITLLGYTIDSNTISPENPLGIRLYWRIEENTDKDYRPVIQLVNLNVSASWAVSQPLDFEGGKIYEASPEQFLSDGHKLELFPDTPPYIGQISVQLLESKNRGIITTLPDGSDRIILSEIVRIMTSPEPYTGLMSNINVGDILNLHCIGLETIESHFLLDMRWQVNQSPTIDYKIFVHGLNEHGQIIHQADKFPLDGLYPSSYWQESQTLNDQIMLDFDDLITLISIGFYNPADETRLPVTSPNEQSDHIEIPIEDNTSCAT